MAVGALSFGRELNQAQLGRSPVEDHTSLHVAPVVGWNLSAPTTMLQNTKT
jgi:hypothetical protein